MEPHIIKHQRVQLGPSVEASAARPRASGKKHVRAIEHEGTVRAIEVTCSCGETTRVELVLDPAKNGPAKGRP